VCVHSSSARNVVWCTTYYYTLVTELVMSENCEMVLDQPQTFLSQVQKNY